MNSKNKFKDFDSLEETQNIKNANDPDSEITETNKNLNIRKIILLIVGLIILVTMIFFIIYYFKSEHNSHSYKPIIYKRKFENQPFQSIHQNQPNNINIQKNDTIQQIPKFENKPIQPLDQNNINLQPNLSLPQILPSPQNVTLQQPTQQSPQQNLIQQQQNLLSSIQQVISDQKNIIYQVYEIQKPLNLNISNYLELFPTLQKKKMSKNITVKKLFNSKILYIKNKNITYDYIHFIRQNDTDEDKYKKKTFENIKFDPNPAIPREGQIPLKAFYKICKAKKIDFLNEYIATKEPNISIIIPVFNTELDIVKTIRSIQSQSLKSLEIIIVDDISTNYNNLYKSFFKNEPRLRIFTQKQTMSIWRKRLDGYLYSRGKYILNIYPGDILSDNYVLEDLFNLVTKYDLDTVRFSFSKTNYNKDFDNNPIFGNMQIYPQDDIKIVYGRPNYDVHKFGYGTIYNRLVRANMFTKGLELVDEYILNANKNLWEDMWWNDLIDRVSFSNLIVNRLGYIFLYNKNTTIEPTIRFDYQRDKTIREFIYFWYFDYQLLPKNNNKKNIVNTIIEFNKNNNTFCKLPMRIDFLLSEFNIYERLLNLLINDPFVLVEDKQKLDGIYKNYKIQKEIFEKKKINISMTNLQKINEIEHLTQKNTTIKQTITTNIINLKNTILMTNLKNTILTTNLTNTNLTTNLKKTNLTTNIENNTNTNLTRNKLIYGLNTTLKTKMNNLTNITNLKNHINKTVNKKIIKNKKISNINKTNKTKTSKDLKKGKDIEKKIKKEKKGDETKTKKITNEKNKDKIKGINKDINKAKNTDKMKLKIQDINKKDKNKDKNKDKKKEKKKEEKKEKLILPITQK